MPETGFQFRVPIRRSATILSRNIYVLVLHQHITSCFVIIMLSYLVAEQVPRINPKMGLRQVEQGFIFCQFLQYLKIFQSLTVPSACSTLKNHQIWQKMKKSLVQLAFNTFFHRTAARCPKTRVWVSLHH